jgi:hypothetical protein
VLAEAQALLRNADHHAADDVDEHDQQSGHGITAHEFGGAVHGAEEAGFVLELAAAPARFRLIDQSGGKVGVDRHLLARHGVEVEAGGHFGNAPGTLGNDHKIDDHQDGEDDDADDEISAHHEIAEGLDHVARGIGALVPAREDQTGRGEIERKPQHGRDQEDGGEGGEFQRGVNEQRRHQDQHGENDRDGQ